MSSLQTPIEWSSIANQHSMTAILGLIIGGLFTAIAHFKWWFIGIYSIVVAVIVLLLEYPRSARPTDAHTSRPRPFQHLLSNFYANFGHLYSHYLTRFIIYFTLSIPCFLTFGTLIPAINLFLTSGFYLISYFHKEEWKKIEHDKKEAYKQITVIRPPERPPPRTLSEIEA